MVLELEQSMATSKGLKKAVVAATTLRLYPKAKFLFLEHPLQLEGLPVGLFER